MDPEIAADLARELPAADFVRVLEMFREEMQQVTAAIATAARAGDRPGFRRATHLLAGAAGSVGAVRLEVTSRKAMTPQDEAADLPSMAAEIGRLVADTLDELDRVLARARSA